MLSPMQIRVSFRKAVLVCTTLLAQGLAPSRTSDLLNEWVWGVLNERTIKSEGSLHRKVLVGLSVRSSERLFRLQMCLKGPVREFPS